jgi:hypothetical protein
MKVRTKIGLTFRSGCNAMGFGMGRAAKAADGGGDLSS